MIKLVSFAIFVGSFIWTWFLFSAPSIVSVEIHAGLQSKLGILIEETVKKAKPSAYNFKIQTMSTETLEKNKVKAEFSYSFSETGEEKDRVNQTIHGEAVLNRAASENPQDERWILQSVKTDQSQIEFQEGLIIGTNTETPDTTLTPENTSDTAAGTESSTTQNTEPASEEKTTE